MTEKTIKILLIEDDPGDVLLIRQMLRKSHLINHELQSSERLSEGLKYIRNEKFDIVLLDLGLPDSHGLDALRTIIAEEPGLPVVVITGVADEEVGLKAVNEGAQSYLVKGETGGKLLVRSIHYAVERKRAQEEQRKLLQMIDLANDAVIIRDYVTDEITYWNTGAERMYGWTSSEALGQYIHAFLQTRFPEPFEKINEEFVMNDSWEGELEHRCREGKKLFVLSRWTLQRDSAGNPVGLLEINTNIRERKLVEEALMDSLEKESLILNSAAEGIFGLDIDGNCTFANRSCLKMLGYEDEKEFLGKNMYELLHCLREDGTPRSKQEYLVNGVLRDGKPFHKAVEYLYRSDGSKIPVEYWTYPIMKGNIVAGAVSTFVDISDSLSLEEQLRQAQKMESVGVLAGGIAHDFNNILSAIVGYSHILLMKMGGTDPMRGNVEEILEAAERAATLTRSLLAFSRKQVLNVKPVDVNELIRGTEQLLRRLVRENIEIRTLLSGDEFIVMADRVQIEQVLINLAVNGRDAMPAGGVLTISTEYLEIDDAYIAAHGYGEAGRYVGVSVSDNGAGMDKETQEKIFQPFYTTKETGKGTGLGLSVVYGIVKQHHGYINVYSEPGRGTRFRIYLPLADAAAGEGQRTKIFLPPLSGSETILVAEDDEKIRKLTKIMLEASGYKVIVASDGEEAVKNFSDNKDIVSLVIIDMIMPRMSGSDVYRAIRQIRPDVDVIFSTGYSADSMKIEESPDRPFHFLMKPVSPSELLRKVRDVLDKK